MASNNSAARSNCEAVTSSTCLPSLLNLFTSNDVIARDDGNPAETEKPAPINNTVSLFLMLSITPGGIAFMRGSQEAFGVGLGNHGSLSGVCLAAIRCYRRSYRAALLSW